MPADEMPANGNTGEGPQRNSNGRDNRLRVWHQLIEFALWKKKLEK